MRIDLHCHSEASHDCLTPLDAIPARCRETGIQVQAITDHNQIWGAQRLAERVASDPSLGLTVIVGEEVSTSEGEIIGLFLERRIPEGMSPEETVDAIVEQGGLVLLPHGFDPLKRYRLQPGAHARIGNRIDIVESFNARVSRPRWNRVAQTWASERDLPISGGSDAHTLRDIGSGWTETPPRSIDRPEDLLAALREGSVHGEWTHPALAFVKKSWTELKARLLG